MRELTAGTPSDAVQTFRMSGCREILTISAGAVTIERQITAIEQAVAQNPSLAFDLAKALVETICRTILTDRGHPYDKTWEMPKLIKETTAKLQFLPDNPSGDASLTEALKRTANAFSNVVVGLAEIRNAGGFASHGKDAYDRGIDDVIQAQFVARAADAVVHFLYRLHRSYTGPLARRPPMQYNDRPDFNTFIDDNHTAITIFDLSFQSSEVLFYTDEDAYRDRLAEFEAEVPSDDDGATPGIDS